MAIKTWFTLDAVALVRLVWLVSLIACRALTPLARRGWRPILRSRGGKWRVEGGEDKKFKKYDENLKILGDSEVNLGQNET